MSTAWIIVAILVFIGIAMTSRMTSAFAKTLMWSQIGIIVLVQIDGIYKGILIWALFAYIAVSLATVVYAFVQKDLRVIDRILIAVSANSIILAQLFTIQRYKGAGILHLVSLLSIVAVLMFMFKGSNKAYNEIGFMVILAVVSGHGFIAYVL